MNCRVEIYFKKKRRKEKESHNSFKRMCALPFESVNAIIITPSDAIQCVAL